MEPDFLFFLIKKVSADKRSLHCKKGKPMYTFLCAQTSSRSLVLDVGEDRLVLTARPSLYHLDIFHPLFINQESSFAQYNSSTQVRTHTNTLTLYTKGRAAANTNLLNVLPNVMCFSGPYSHHACGLFLN